MTDADLRELLRQVDAIPADLEPGGVPGGNKAGRIYSLLGPLVADCPSEDVARGIIALRAAVPELVERVRAAEDALTCACVALVRHGDQLTLSPELQARVQAIAERWRAQGGPG